jgi:hypothetical protein
MEIFWSFISNYLILFRKFVNFIFEIKKGSLATPREGALLRVCLPPRMHSGGLCPEKFWSF